MAHTMINEVKLNLPELHTCRLIDLRKGKVFMTKKAFYTEGTSIYMVLKNDYTSTVTAVCLQDGEQKVFGSDTRVVELTVKLEAKLYEATDDLPF